MATTKKTTNPVEAWLDSRLVKWVFREDVPLDEFDEAESLRNQARFEPLQDEIVARYAEAMLRGEDFPPAVGFMKGKKIILMDGNHRFHSKKRAGLPGLDVYIVEASPETIQVLTFEANTRHGMPPSNEERVRHAIYLIDNGAKHEDAAATVGLTVSQVTASWNVERAERRARSLGVTRGWTRLSKEAKERLGGVATDPGFVAAAKLAIDANMSGPEVRSMTQEMRKLRSDRQQVQLVSETRESLRRSMMENGGSVVTRARPDARRIALPHVSYVSSLDVEAVINSCTSPEQREDMIKRALKAIDSLAVLVDGLNKK